MNNMKHNILVLTASVFGAAMLLGSCQERLGGESNIGFTADVASYKGYNVGSKAAPIGDPLNQPDTYVDLFQTTYGAAGFNVKAYKGTTLRLDGTSKYTNGDWTLDQTAKWYSGENLDFYAIAPVNNRGITGVNVDPATKKMSFTYQVQTNKGISQPDIMVGYYSGPGVESTTAGKRIAPLTFYHPLAAVRFKAGDIDGAALKSVAINGLYDNGTATIDIANMGSAGAVTWAISSEDEPDAVSGFPFEPAITVEQGTYIGGPESAIMVIPQVLSDNAFLSIEIVNPDADDDPATPDDYLRYIVSLKEVELKAGTILDITINYKGIVLEIFNEPDAMIIPWVDAAPIIEVTDPQLVPVIAYLTNGSDFNEKIVALAGGAGNIAEIVFDRFGSVDEHGVQIQADRNVDPRSINEIYASYDDNTAVVTITTHANTIYANADCSYMFQNLIGLDDIDFGGFFSTKETTNISHMFEGCSQIRRLNLTDVLLTQNVTNMSHLFNNCTNLRELYLGSDFDTSNVTNMSYMFNNCKQLPKLSLGVHFDTSKVTDMSYMFCQCSQLTYLDLRAKFYTSKVTTMDYMFYGCSRLANLHLNNHFLVNPLPGLTGEQMLRYGLGTRKIYCRIAAYNWLIDTAHNTYASGNWNTW